MQVSHGLPQGAERAEADRARARLLTLDGWTSARIAQAFGVREDTVRLWRSDFVRGGVDALRARVAPGPVPLKAQGRSQGRGSAFVGAGGRPTEPDVVAPRRRERATRRPQYFTLAALLGAAQKRGVSIRRPLHTLKGRQCADEVDRVGLRLTLRKAQAAVGDIVLLFVDESEALTHPYLARAWAERGADLRVEAPGQAKKIAMMGAPDWRDRLARPPVDRRHLQNQAQRRLHRLSGRPRSSLWPQIRPMPKTRRHRARQRPDPYQQGDQGRAGRPRPLA